MKPLTNIDDAIACIRAYDGPAETFELPVTGALLDPAGINMAVITDCILEKGWEPDGFQQLGEYRVYRYRTAHS